MWDKPTPKRQGGKASANSRIDNQLSISEMEVRERTRSALSKLSTEQQKKGMKQQLFHVDITKYLMAIYQ